MIALACLGLVMSSGSSAAEPVEPSAPAPLASEVAPAEVDHWRGVDERARRVGWVGVAIGGVGLATFGVGVAAIIPGNSEWTVAVPVGWGLLLVAPPIATGGALRSRRALEALGLDPPGPALGTAAWTLWGLTLGAGVGTVVTGIIPDAFGGLTTAVAFGSVTAGLAVAALGVDVALLVRLANVDVPVGWIDDRPPWRVTLVPRVGRHDTGFVIACTW